MGVTCVQEPLADLAQESHGLVEVVSELLNMGGMPGQHYHVQHIDD